MRKATKKGIIAAKRITALLLRKAFKNKQKQYGRSRETNSIERGTEIANKADF